MATATNLLHVSVSDEDPCPVVVLAGELDAYTAPVLRTTLEELISGGATDLALDLSGLSFASSDGYRVMILAARALEGVGRVELRSPRAQVAKALEISGLREHFTIV